MPSLDITNLVFIGQPPNSCSHFRCKDAEQESEELERWREKKKIGR